MAAATASVADSKPAIALLADNVPDNPPPRAATTATTTRWSRGHAPAAGSIPRPADWSTSATRKVTVPAGKLDARLSRRGDPVPADMAPLVCQVLEIGRVADVS
jgi:hypothetical protein